MTRRNPIQVYGDRLDGEWTQVCNDLARNGAREMGLHGFALMVNLLSHDPERGTSAREIAELLGWGRNRATKNAFEAAVKDRRLVLREYVRDGLVVRNKSAYALCPGGRRFTDEELADALRPIVMPPRGQRGTAQGGAT